MDFAYLPYLVADGEEGDGYDEEDGEEEVEETGDDSLIEYVKDYLKNS